MIFEAHHADYLVRLFSENLSYDELATRMSKQFRVRITARSRMFQGYLLLTARAGDWLRRSVTITVGSANGSEGDQEWPKPNSLPASLSG